MNFIKRQLFKYLFKSIDLTQGKAFRKQFANWLEENTSNTNNVGYISACADVYGKWFASSKLRLYDDNNEEVEQHPILNLFKKPNNAMSMWEMKYRIATDFTFYGNSYFYKIRNKLNIPILLQQLHPNKITTNPYNKEVIESYSYDTGDGQLHEIAKRDVIHFRYPDPDNYILGNAIINKILDLKEVEKMQLSYIKQFYSAGGFLGATFTTPKELSKTSFDRAYQALTTKYGDTSDAFKVGLFDSDLRPVPTAYSIKDMELSLQRELNKKEILAAFQVNKLLLGESEGIQRGNAETVFYVFASQVIDPLLNYITDKLTSDLCYDELAKFDPVYIKHDNMAQRDTLEEIKYYDIMTRAGILSINECRELEGYKPFPDNIYNLPIINYKPLDNGTNNGTDSATQ